MTRAAADEWPPPQPVTKPQVSRARALRVFARVILSLGLAAVASAPAFAQRGGTRGTSPSCHADIENNASGSHINEGSRVSSEAHATSAAKSSALSQSPKSASVETPLTSAGVQSESFLQGSTSVAPPTSSHLESTEKEAAAPLQPTTVYPEKVVI